MAEETGDIERMIFLLEARTNELEKGMKKADAIAKKAYAGMKRDSATATDKMERDMIRSTNSINRALAATSTRIGSFGKSMIAGFAGGLAAGGIAGIVTRLGQVASGVAAIGDEARRAGLDVKAFQELKYVADQNRVSVDALTDGMKELSLRADEFIVTGGGSAAEAFQRLGYGADELHRKLQDPSALFTEIIGKLQNLDRAAQIRIADELFGGTGGEQFVQLLAQGEEGIRRTIAEAHQLGIVMDADVIAKAAEVDRRFNQIANTIGSGVRGAVVDATFALMDFITAQERAIQNNRLLAMADDAMAQYQQQLALITEYLDAAGRVAPEIEPQVRRIASAFEDGSLSAKDAADQLRALGAVNLDAFPITTGLSNAISLIEQLVGRARNARMELASLNSDPIGPGATWEGVQALTFGSEPPKPRTVPGSGRPASGGGGGRSAGISEAEREAKAIQNLIAGLEFERSLIGLSAVEQAKMNALRQAGASATEEQRAQIARLVEETHAEQARIDGLTATYDAMGQAGMAAFQGIVGAMEDGKIEAHELLGILVQVLQTFGSVGGGGGNPLINIATALLGGSGMKIPGFKDGGSGVVPGSGPPDSRLFVAKVTPGEPYAFGPQAVQGMGKRGAANITITQAFDFKGTMMPEDVANVVRQANQQMAPQIMDAVKRSLPGWQTNIQIHGAP